MRGFCDALGYGDLTDLGFQGAKMILSRCVLDFGGGVQMISVKYIGRNGMICVMPRKRVAWVFGAYQNLILRCWRSKLGGLSLTRILLWHNCAHWQIGNGNNVLMLRDSWIPNTITHKPQLLGPVQDNLAKETRKILKWQCPPVGWLKVNFDGAFSPSSGKAVIGFLVRDSQGTFLGAVGRVVTRVQSAEHVELLACKEAFGYVMEHGLCPVILETDCLVLKQQVCQEELQNYSILGRLYEDLSKDLKEVNQVRIIHARREANMAAHKLAAHAADLDQAFFWSNIPSFIQDVIESEK
ncbi:uncharacterized protein LOC133716270 [Rosa rugosa]|uniref:uncharacterized protein LOC133716270 n=1 Tax=Rosa rugosa TaxID=74645 RepID=UPI002B41685B|nr:uncharacterized protein LOC133716270 [Rosa rugosa]